MTRITPPAHTILVVEDDDDSRTLLGHLLTGEGYAVAMARNGLEALDAARSRHPALILLDVQMPIMDGVAFRQRQLDDPDIASIPVVCVSALDHLALQSRELETVEFVRKPIDFDRLLGLISAATADFATSAMSRVIAPMRVRAPGLYRGNRWSC